MANTGKKITLTLRKYQEPGHINTGVTKQNIPGDADYQAPVIDFVACPVAAGTTCPVVKKTLGTGTIEFEFSLDGSTFSNANIKKVRVKTTDAAVKTFNLPQTNNWFHYIFTGASVSANLTVLEMLNASDIVVKTCELT